jgi:hypothetical protein
MNPRPNSHAARQSPERASQHQGPAMPPRPNGRPTPTPDPEPGPDPSLPPRSNTTQEFSFQEAPWPKPIAEEAFYGIAGCFVRIVEEHTEADRNWLLVLFLLLAGNVLGRNRYFMVGGDQHFMKIFACAVGPSDQGRKGSANGPVELFFRYGPYAPGLNLLTGVASGEGLIWAIHDPIVVKVKNKKTGEIKEECIDEGVEDKRLVVNVGEFFGLIQVMRRQGSTVSRIIRDAWDRDLLVAPSKNSPAKSTGAHVSIAGNISKEELLRAIEEGDADNGVLNRFLWMCSRRARILPEGGRLFEVIQSSAWQDLQREFNQAMPREEALVKRDAEAADLWGYDAAPAGLYRDLTRERYGMTGKVTGRSAPQVLRLALICATLDRSIEIRREHLDAALAVVRYSEASAEYIFGEMLEDPVANTILNALRMAPAGMTRSELSELLQRNKTAGQITQALVVLHRKGVARFERAAPTEGRRPSAGSRWGNSGSEICVRIENLRNKRN